MSIDSKTRKEYTKIASYYYELGMTQEEIAKSFSLSRQKINRILKKCVELGIVKITIQNVEENNIDMEMELEKKYGLREAILVDPGENLFESLGKASANYLYKVINDNDRIGFSRGRTLSSLLDYLNNITKKNLTVCQLSGGKNHKEEFLNNDAIVRRAADKMNGRSFFLYAPTVVTSGTLKESLIQEESFIEVYEKLKSCTVAVVGIGLANKHRKSSLSDEDYIKVLKRNAVGEICLRHFDIDGNSVNEDVDSKVIGIETGDFKNIPLRIGIAGGIDKTKAIKGALNGNFINVLITDTEVANELLK